MSGRKHGSQLVDEDLIGTPGFDEAYAAAKAALGTPLVQACHRALEVVAEEHGLQACDPDGDDCSFPQCLALGCEAEPKS
jgi:hypothetical protein